MRDWFYGELHGKALGVLQAGLVLRRTALNRAGRTAKEISKLIRDANDCETNGVLEKQTPSIL